MNLLALLVSLVLALTSGSPAGSTSVAHIEIRAGEHDSAYYYAPNELSVQPGPVRVTFVNEGAQQHTFNVKKRDEWRDLYNFPLVQPGGQDVFEFEFLEPGSYVFYCQLYKHVDRGQTGLLLVSP